MQSKKNAAGTSGQNVPKPPKSKFRQKSNVEQTAASKLRMEKRADDLEKAKERLTNQKSPKKPGPVKKAGRAVGNTVHGYVHRKIYEVEHENVGTEGAHQAESLVSLFCAMVHGLPKSRYGNILKGLSRRPRTDIYGQLLIISIVLPYRNTPRWKVIQFPAFGKRNG